VRAHCKPLPTHDRRLLGSHAMSRAKDKKTKNSNLVVAGIKGNGTLTAYILSPLHRWIGFKVIYYIEKPSLLFLTQ
jgi:hypothetical protein